MYPSAVLSKQLVDIMFVSSYHFTIDTNYTGFILNYDASGAASLSSISFALSLCTHRSQGGHVGELTASEFCCLLGVSTSTVHLPLNVHHFAFISHAAIFKQSGSCNVKDEIIKN